MKQTPLWALWAWFVYLDTINTDPLSLNLRSTTLKTRWKLHKRFTMAQMYPRCAPHSSALKTTERVFTSQTRVVSSSVSHQQQQLQQQLRSFTCATAGGAVRAHSGAPQWLPRKRVSASECARWAWKRIDLVLRVLALCLWCFVCVRSCRARQATD